MSAPTPASVKSVQAGLRHILIIMVSLGIRKDSEGQDGDLEGTEAIIYDLTSQGWLAGAGDTLV